LLATLVIQHDAGTLVAEIVGDGYRKHEDDLALERLALEVRNGIGSSHPIRSASPEASTPEPTKNRKRSFESHS